MRLLIEQTIADCASARLEEFAGEFVLGLVNAHTDGTELHDVVASAVPNSAGGFRDALHHTFEQVLARADNPQRYSLDETERMLFVLPRMVESLVHGGAGAPLSRNSAKSEAIRTVQVYVNSFQRSAAKHY